MGVFRSGAIALLVAATALVAGAWAAPAFAGIRIDSAAARATLAALGRADLSRDDALKVADLPGNRAIVQKLQEFGQTADRNSFADALLVAAHDGASNPSYGFARVKRGRETALKLLDRIDAEPAQFRDWIAARIAPFTPKDIALDATGYLIVGGSADGFSFDKPEFFMDISKFGDDFGAARVIMAHELYHAVQNIALARYTARTGKDPVPEFKRETYEALPAGPARACYATRAIFGSLLAEGTATYVGDPALLPEHGVYSDAERGRRTTSQPSMRNRVALLEMSMASVSAADPVPPAEVYSVDFYDNAPLYDLGYVMAKAIAAHDGEAALGVLIGQPGDAFVRRYLALGADPAAKLPKLGPQAALWAGRSRCPLD